MTIQRYDFNDLTGDIAHLSTLIQVITDFAIEVVEPEKSVEDSKREISRLTDLLWIARDLVTNIDQRTNDVRAAFYDEMAAIRKAVAP